MNEAEDRAVVVRDELRRLNPLLRATRKHLRSAQRDEYGRILPGPGCLDLQVSWKLLRRSSLIVDALLKACAARGWAISLPQGQTAGTLITVGSTAVPIRISEGLDREPLGPEEQGRPLKHLGPHPVYKRFANGRIVFSILGRVGGRPTRSWREGKRLSAEYRVAKFIDKIGSTAAWLKREEEDRIAAAARARQKEQAEWETEKAYDEEKRRLAELLSQAESWHRSQLIRAFIEGSLAARKAAGVECGPSTAFGKWVQWAQHHADRLDPLTKAPPSVLDHKPLTFWDMMGVDENWWHSFFQYPWGTEQGRRRWPR